MKDGQRNDEQLDEARALGVERAEQLLRGVIIPPRPTVLVDVLEQQRSGDADLDRIASLIENDVALSAGTLKVVNSTFFGLRRKIGSVSHAVRLLGVNNVVNIVTGLMLHSAFSGTKAAFMDEYWTWSSRRAMVAAGVAARTGAVQRDEAYAVGLFADCGVPLLFRKFPEYPNIYRAAELAQEVTATAFEDARLGTDHAVVGYIMGRSWKLPDSFCQCILRHHDTTDSFTQSQGELDDAAGLLATLLVSNHVMRMCSGLPVTREWEAVGIAVTAHLGLTEAQLAGILADAEGQLTEEANTIELP